MSSLQELLKRPGSRKDCFGILLCDYSNHLCSLSRTGEFLVRADHRGTYHEAKYLGWRTASSFHGSDDIGLFDSSRVRNRYCVGRKHEYI